MSKIKVIIFDMDGTLADTVESIRKALNNTLMSCGFPKMNHEQTVAAIGCGARTLIERSIPKEHSTNASLVAEVLDRYRCEYEKTYADGVVLYDGMDKAINALASRGYKLAILSNKPDRFVRALADLLFPAGVFSHAEGQTDKPMKPDPTVPLLIAEKLGAAPSECAFIGDSDIDILTAKNSGMLAVGCSWGYRDRETIINAGADIIIDKPVQLAEIFK